MSTKKKIKVTFAMINVLLTAVEFYLQWQLSKSENELQLSKKVGSKRFCFSPIFSINKHSSFSNGSNMFHKKKNKKTLLNHNWLQSFFDFFI